MSLMYSSGGLRQPASGSPTEIGTLSLRDVRRPLHIDTSLHSGQPSWQHLYVLPVLLMEFSALALTRAVLPSLLLQQFGNRVYLIMGCVECVRGLLAFIASPIFGKVSDVTGRRLCLLVTVLGTCAPVCSLAFFSWEPMFVLPKDDGNITAVAEAATQVGGGTSDESGVWPTTSNDDESFLRETVHPTAIVVFVVLLSLSGIFSSTFTLVFAYISDTVRQQDERVSAYGLALATFGLSFTIGPMAGGYLAKYSKQYVFVCSLLLTVLDLLYIYFILPESREVQQESAGSVKSSISLMTMDYNFSWNPWDTVKVIAVDPFLRKVGEVAFLYYTGLWAIISTLSVYAVKRFHLSPERLGELMSALGLCTMVAEAVLVRIVVPLLGEKQSMKAGLLSFGMQCIVLGFAFEPWHLFFCAVFSLAGNLVYPSLSSLVSGNVEPDSVGEALGAVNGIKALTEGIGPLVFGSLMTLSEHSALPGWPYLLAALLVVAAYRAADELPDSEEDDYIHELDRRRRRGGRPKNGQQQQNFVHRVFGSKFQKEEEDEDYVNLLSEIDVSDDDLSDDDGQGGSQFPITLSSLISKE